MDYLTLNASQEAKAREIHARAVVVDGLTYMIAPESDGYIRTIIEGGITATNVTIPQVLDNFEQTTRRVADWYQSFKEFGDILTLALSVEDIRRAKADGKTAVIMGFQDTKPFENELQLVDIFWRLGVRIVQLTYQGQNFVGCGCAEPDPGLTAFGRQMVKRLNELGILVDLSHCGPKTTADAIKASSRPVAFTHAGVLQLRKHVRNKSDDLIKAVADSGGLLGIPSYSQFLDIRNSHAPTIVEYLDVIEYVIQLTGIDHVGLGFDFTPTWTRQDYDKAAKSYPEIYLDFSFEDTPIRGLLGVKDSINVTRGLVARGYSEEDIRKVLGENFLRLFGAVWQ